MVDRVSLSKLSAFRISIAAFLGLSLVLSKIGAHASPGQEFQMSTWSIVAVDPATGDVGVAAASCVPNTHIDSVAALVPGKGAAATQALFNLGNRNRVFRLLLEGVSANEIIRQVTDPEADSRAADRQYGVVTMSDSSVHSEGFTGSDNLYWAGSQKDAELGVTVQGNILESEAVVSNALDAFRSDSEPGYNTLPDRLMRALEAGSTAGGDSRCNNDQVEQTAATAFILVARGTDKPYAAIDIGVTDMGDPDAPWLALSVTESRFGANPLVELRELYDVWREINLGSTEISSANPWTYAAAVAVVFVLVVLAGIWIRRKYS